MAEEKYQVDIVWKNNAPEEDGITIKKWNGNKYEIIDNIDYSDIDKIPSQMGGTRRTKKGKRKMGGGKKNRALIKLLFS
jgi:hypothetical protein